jgi:hypothetical protein
MLAFTVAITSASVNAQDWKMPEDLTLEKEEDYAKYKNDVLACIDWLEKTPQNTKEEARKEANAFLLVWITGSPDVSIELNGDIVTFLGSEEQAELLLTFMGGWTRYALTDKDGGKDAVQGNLAGLRSVIKVYRDVGGVKKNKEVDKLVKLEKDGKLEDWVKEKLKKK